MRHVFATSLVGCGLMLFGVAAATAQDRDRDDRYHQGDRDEGYWRGRLFQRVRDDISHIQATTPYFSSDQFRLSRVKAELNELQSKYADHGYDSQEMDDVVSALERVVSDNHLSGRERDMLNDDLNHLREFRDHHEGYR